MQLSCHALASLANANRDGKGRMAPLPYQSGDLVLELEDDHALRGTAYERQQLLGELERDKLLFWFVQAAMWGRFSGSTESFIDQDLAALEGADGGLDKLLDQLRLWHGGLRAEPGHFTGWSLGARFYPVLYLLTRMGESRDWGTGLPLKLRRAYSAR